MDLKKKTVCAVLGIILAAMALGAYRYSGTFEDDQKLLRNALLHSPNSYSANADAGSHAFNQKKFEEALPFFEKAVQVNPLLLSIQEQLAYIYLTKNEYAQAEKHLRDILRKDPDYTDIYFHLGEVCYKRKKYAEAKRFFQQDFARTHRQDTAKYLDRISKETGI